MKSWTCFILGNAIVVVVVIIEILTLSVCFTDLDQSEGFDDDRLDAAKLDEEEAYELDQAEHTVFNMVSFFFCTQSVSTGLVPDPCTPLRLILLLACDEFRTSAVR